MATTVNESILQSTKKLVGLDSTYEAFDLDIIVHINSALMFLRQLGIGPSTGFSITDADDKWSDFLSESTNLEAVKSYVALKVRVLFDPPNASTVLEALNRQITELEWRLTIEN